MDISQHSLASPLTMAQPESLSLGYSHPLLGGSHRESAAIFTPALSRPAAISDRQPSLTPSLSHSRSVGQFAQATESARTPAQDELTGLPQTRAAALNSAHSLTQPTAPHSRAVGLPYPGRILSYAGTPRYDSAAKQWQTRMQERGWSIQADGLYGAQSANICRQFQQEKGLQVDGRVGAATWTAAFRADNLAPATTGPYSAYSGPINAQGLSLLKRSEGLVLSAYRDPVGIWTIGYGHTGPEVKPGLKISPAQAETLLRKDLGRFESVVRSLVKVPVNANQFSALVSFTYNVGTGALGQSTLLSLLNQQNYQGAANEFSRWVYGGGQALPGLVKRRSQERALFLTPA